MSNKKKILFIANNNEGFGLSGGDRIFVELIRNWETKLDIVLAGSAEAMLIAERYGLWGVKKILIDKANISKSHTSLLNLLIHTLRRTYKSVNFIRINKSVIKELDFIYSVSDFLPDLIPAFYAKLINRNVKIIAGYYLFAPFPLSSMTPYKDGNRIRGFLYWLMQRPTYFLVKKFADFVLVTSEPDVKKFLTKKEMERKFLLFKAELMLLNQKNISIVAR